MKEKNDIKIPILRSIGNVYKKSSGCKLKDEFFAENASDLKILSDFYNVTPFQALIISCLFTFHFGEDELTLETLIGHFACLPTKLLEFTPELDDLDDRGIVSTNSRRQSGLGFSLGYKTIRSVFSSDSSNDKSNVVFENAVDLCEEFHKVEDLFYEQGICDGEMGRRLNSMLINNQGFPFVQALLSAKLSEIEIFLFLKLVDANLEGYNCIVLDSVVSRLMNDRYEKIKYLQTFARKVNPLLTHQLVEVNSGGFINDADILLTAKSLALLSESGINVKLEKPRHDNVIIPENIGAKKLYFNERESRELDMLSRSLNEKNLFKIRTSLKKKNLPTGITILLYGKPGTGKTESVKQIAKKTGREIFHVDISNTKSKWFGDSEKQIKKIFTDYADYAKHSNITPILLFNEADAIISKRKDVSASNIAATENAIQNIILEELENFNGIFMATTNLIGNLDPAFERRFLFKIRFEQPSVEIKARIWKSKMPSLTKAECNKLAENFEFSGGEIDNIIRKCETHTIVYRRKTNIDMIMEFCHSEKLVDNKTTKIGFERSIS